MPDLEQNRLRQAGRIPLNSPVMNPESPYPAGTLAIVRTPRFRCMAMLRENGEWIDVLHPECPLERPSVVEVIYRAPACGVGRAVKRVVAS